jgi:short-subunit dehydrogenase
VLNAGTWSRFRVDEWDSDLFADHMRTNLMGTVHSLEGVVPTMLAEGRGRIVGVASVAGYRGLPGSEAYGASKAAMLNLLEALRGALAPRGVVVQTVSPGFVKTPMTDRNSFPMPFLIPAESAARTIADGIEKGKAEIVFPFPMMLLMKTVRLLPVRMWTVLTALMNRRGLTRS